MTGLAGEARRGGGHLQNPRVKKSGLRGSIRRSLPPRFKPTPPQQTPPEEEKRGGGCSAFFSSSPKSPPHPGRCGGGQRSDCQVSTTGESGAKAAGLGSFPSPALEKFALAVRGSLELEGARAAGLRPKCWSWKERGRRSRAERSPPPPANPRSRGRGPADGSRPGPSPAGQRDGMCVCERRGVACCLSPLPRGAPHPPVHTFRCGWGHAGRGGGRAAWALLPGGPSARTTLFTPRK